MVSSPLRSHLRPEDSPGRVPPGAVIAGGSRAAARDQEPTGFQLLAVALLGVLAGGCAGSPEGGVGRKVESRGAPQASVSFRLNERDLIPEGIAHDPVTQRYFLSSVYKAKIVAIESNGGVSDFTAERAAGFGSGLGMTVDADARILWAATAVGPQMRGFRPEDDGISGVFRYSVDDGSLLDSFVLGSDSTQHLFNDLVLADDGSVFVTDSRTASVYRIAPGADSLELFVQSDTMTSPNGIAVGPDQQVLFVAHGDGVTVVSRADRSLRRLSAPDDVQLEGIDGLYYHKKALVAIQNHRGFNRVVRMWLDTSLLRGPIPGGSLGGSPGLRYTNDRGHCGRCPTPHRQ